MYQKIFYTTLLAGLVSLTACKNNNSATENTATTPQPTINSNLDKAFHDCKVQFFEQNQPNLPVNLTKNTYPLCFDGFAVMYSGVSKTPIWVAEYLTKQRLLDAKQLERDDSFHAEERLPQQVRSQLADYKRSGYDRGHLAPNGDMADNYTQYESFSLANIAPQNGTHNRNVWRYIESATRRLTEKHGEVYVVTGVAFEGKAVSRIGGRVLVPSHFFKAVYIPSENRAGVYYSPNTENPSYEIISLTELAHRTGIVAMPSVPKSVQDHAHRLPRPNADGTIAMNEQELGNGVWADEIDLTSLSGWLMLALAIFKHFIGVINQ